MRSRTSPLLLGIATTAALLFAATGCDDGGVPDHVAEKMAEIREKDPQLAKRKIMLLGFDACDPELVDDLIRRGKLPNFARLRREGASGSLESIVPVLSPVVWTSIATGMTPERHGIMDFVTSISDGAGGQQKVPVSSKLRRADTVWELIARGGDKVGVVGWLVTYPADPEPNAFIVTERMGLLAYEYGKKQSTSAPQRTYPEELTTEYAGETVTIDDLSLSDIRPFANVSEDEFAAAYSPEFHPRNSLGNLRLTLATAETFRNMGLRLNREQDPRFFACYFEAMDALSHLFMRYAPPQMDGIPDEDYGRYKTAIEANYMWHDQALGEFMEQADEDTTLFVVSDHGFKSGSLRTPDGSNFHEKTGAQWHRRFGVIYAWGNGVAKGRKLVGSRIYDIAPTILASMGYPVPEDMVGKVLTDIFEDGLGVGTVETYYGLKRSQDLVNEHVSASAESQELSPEDQETMDRLKAIGYLPGDDTLPTSTTVMNRASRLLAQRRPLEALAEFEKIYAEEKAADVLTPRIFLMMANARVQAGTPDQLDEAEKDLEGALELHKKMWPTIEKRLLAEGRKELAARGRDHDADMLLLRGRIEFRRGNLDTAEEAIRESIVTKDYLPGSHMALAELLETRLRQARRDRDAVAVAKHRQDAIRAYETALSLEPRQFTALKDLARLRLSLQTDLVGNARAALEYLDRALEIIPRSPDALNNRSIALLRLALAEHGAGRAADGNTKLEQALESADKAIESKNPYSIAQANKAYVLWKMGRLPDAHAAALAAVEHRPDYKFDAGFLKALRAAGLKLPERTVKSETGGGRRDRTPPASARGSK